MTLHHIEVTDDVKVADITRLIDEHYHENPTHGAGCACLDTLVSTVRYLTQHTNIKERIRQDDVGEHNRKVQNAVDSLMVRATRRF